MWRIAVLVLLGCLLGCARVEPATPSAAVLFTRAEQQLAAGDYSDAIKTYESLELNYPLSEYNERALRSLMQAYYANNDYLTAGAVAARFVRLYPQSRDADYAYYIKGLSNYHQERGVFSKFFSMDLAWRNPGSQSQAYDDFAVLVKRFPKSIYTAEAQTKMQTLRDRAARHEFELAKFYLKDRKYVAARNRAANVIAHFAESQYVKEAQVIYTAANKKLALLA